MSKRVSLAIALYFSIVCTPAQSQAPSPQTDPTSWPIVKLQLANCKTVEECVAAIRNTHVVNGADDIYKKFADYGEPGVAALMKLLEGDEPWPRNNASRILWQYDQLDERYLPLLLREDRKGNELDLNYKGRGWLGHVIGRVGTPAAIEYLLDRFADNPQYGIHDYVGPGILRNGQKIVPLVRTRIEGFPRDGNPQFLTNLVRLAEGGGVPFGWAMPDWVEPSLVRIATSPDYPEKLKTSAAYELERFKSPLALARMITDFRAVMAKVPPYDGRSLFLKGDEWEKLQDDKGYWAQRFASFGSAAQNTGSLLLPLLDRPDMPESRADAALALGEIGYRRAIPKLLNLKPVLNDDWLLAYNVTEALGRLRAGEAVGMLREIAKDYWHPAVRNNALRALNFIVGGSFARPEVAGDGDAYTPDNTDDFDIPDFRYAGDRGARSAWKESCYPLNDAEKGKIVRISQFPIDQVRFPQRGFQCIAPASMSSGKLNVPRSAIRDASKRGAIVVYDRKRSGTLIGTVAGEFVGGLDFIASNGQVMPLVPHDILLAVRSGKKLFVFVGLTHLGTSYGEIWIYDDSGPRPSPLKRIRLPGEPSRFGVTDRRLLIVETLGGDAAIDEDGNMVDPSFALRSSRND